MKRAVALGFFDGVHIGHGELFKTVKRASEENALTPCVLTYAQHPSEVLSSSGVSLINTVDERILLISGLYGIDDIVIKDFTEKYASLSCEDFFENILIGELDCGFVVAGFDFRFGHLGRGDAELLKKLCRDRNIGCEIVDEVMLGDVSVSSSHIRTLILDGKPDTAAKLLGHNHFITGKVLHGQAIGKKLGFATANQKISENIVTPKPGVYATRVTVDNMTYKAITNVGTRPTVTDDKTVFAESHIFDFSDDIYGKMMKTEFVSFLREEKKFSSHDELCEQISQDILRARLEN